MEEYIDVVNENDEIIGKDLKSEKKIKGFISRTVAIFILNSNKNFIICKRGAHKKNDPNLFDLSAYGNVMAGETYDHAATRELLEELNISCELKFLDKYYQEIRNGENLSKIFCAVYLGVSDQLPKLNFELTNFREVSFCEIEKEIQEKPEMFCQGFKNDFIRVKSRLKNYI